MNPPQTFSRNDWIRAIDLAVQVGALSITQANSLHREVDKGTLPFELQAFAQRLALPSEGVQSLLTLAHLLQSDPPAPAAHGEFLNLMRSFRRLRTASSNEVTTVELADDTGEMANVEENRERLGRYILLSKAASGGMGVVYRAWDPSLARIVAVKMLKGEPDAELRGRFIREARAIARLDHPGIVKVHDVGEEGNRPYLTMDFLPGGSFDRVLAEKAGFESLQERIEYLRDIARAVGYAHTQGIVHRDLKPGNILLDLRGQPVVTDFGLAKDALTSGSTHEESTTQTGSIMGTPSYMSPEQAIGTPVGPPSDVFSLGVILYQTLTGKLPFQGQGVPAILSRIVNSDPILPRSWEARIPRELQTICLKSLEKEQGRRYANGNEVADELGRWLEGEPIRAAPVGWWTRGYRRLRRNRLAMGVSTFSLITLLSSMVALAYQLWSAGQREQWEQLLNPAAITIMEGYGQRHHEMSDWMRGRLESALSQIDRVLEKENDHPRALCLKGICLRLLGKCMLAREALSKSVQMDPESAVARFHRGELRLHDFMEEVSIGQANIVRDESGMRIVMSNPYRLERENPKAAELYGLMNDFRNLGAGAPRQDLSGVESLGDLQRLYAQGILSFFAGRYEECATDLSEVLQMDPDHFEALGTRASCYLWGHQNLNLAIRDLELLRCRAGKKFMDPTPLAWAYFNTEKYKEAIGIWAEIIIEDPNRIEAYRGRAISHRAIGEHDAALADLDEAVRRDTRGARALWDRAFLKQEAHDWKGADADYTAALARDPKAWPILHNRGVARLQMGNIEGAIDDLNRFLKTEDSNYTAHFNRALAYTAKGEPDSAIADYNRVLCGDPKHLMSLINHGNLLKKAGRRQEAKSDYDQAIQHHPTSPEAYAARGILLAEEGETQAASADLNTALENAPADWPYRPAIQQKLDSLSR